MTISSRYSDSNSYISTDDRSLGRQVPRELMMRETWGAFLRWSLEFSGTPGNSSSECKGTEYSVTVVNPEYFEYSSGIGA
jgi:hypothetical protein